MGTDLAGISNLGDLRTVLVAASAGSAKVVSEARASETASAPARTPAHKEMTGHEKSFPWLRKIMKEGEIRYKQVNKNKKDLMTVFGPLKDYHGNTIGVLAIPNDITSTMNTIRSNTYKMAGIGL